MDIEAPRLELAFTPPMECASVTHLPEGPEWSYEIKLDGYRAQAIHLPGEMRMISRNGKDITGMFDANFLPELACAVPPGAAVDGELCALDEHGRPNFQLLQNSMVRPQLVFFAFDLLGISRREITHLKLDDRRSMMQQFIRPSHNVRISEPLDLNALQMMNLVRKHGLEGVVAKRRDSLYEAGRRSGEWAKLRLTRAQEFVIGGFTWGSYGFDALIIGFYRAGRLLYCGRVRNGFIPAVRQALYKRLWPLVTKDCPFNNLPETGDPGMGQGITADKMRECVWVRPALVAQFAFLEWTSSERLKHVRYLGLRDDKNPHRVVKEV